MVLAQFRDFTEHKQDLEGYNSAEIGDGATKVFDVTQFLMRKLKKSLEKSKLSKEPAVNRAIDYINNFTKKLETKAGIDSANSKTNNNNDLNENIAIFTEYVLKCYIKRNTFLTDADKRQKLDKLREWIKSYGHVFDNESNRIMNMVGIYTDNFAKKRISFDVADFILLNEDLPDMPSVETTQQPKTEIEKEPKVISLPKKQEVKNDSSSLESIGETSNTDHSVNNPPQDASNSSSTQTGVANGSITTHNQNLVDDRIISAKRMIGQSANGPDASPFVDQDGANNKKSFLGENADSEVNSNTVKLEESLCDSIGQRGVGNEQNLISANNLVVPNLEDNLNGNITNSLTTPKTEYGKSNDKKASTWGKKIAIASIAVVVVILLSSLSYGLRHLFYTNK